MCVDADAIDPTDLGDGERFEAGVCFTGALAPRSCLSLVLDVTDVTDARAAASRAPSGHATVQAALSYVASGGDQRIRVFTLSAPLTSDASEWLDSVDTGATALLAARLAALRACAAERATRDAHALAAQAVLLGSGWARRYGAALTEVRAGWLWSATHVVGYDASAAPLAELLRGLYRLRTCAPDRLPPPRQCRASKAAPMPRQQCRASKAAPRPEYALRR